MRAPFLDHITVEVRDLAASQAFYEAALAPFGVRVVEHGEGEMGVGPEGSEDLGLSAGEPRAPSHIAFLPADPATVDAFHAGNNVEAVCHTGPTASEALGPAA